MSRQCANCQKDIPPETEHFAIEDEPYCTDCVEITPYTAYLYYVDGEFVGTSEDDQVRHIESLDDDYEGGQ
jgi:hypothetical protein